MGIFTITRVVEYKKPSKFLPIAGFYVENTSIETLYYY